MSIHPLTLRHTHERAQTVVCLRAEVLFTARIRTKMTPQYGITIHDGPQKETGVLRNYTKFSQLVW